MEASTRTHVVVPTELLKKIDKIAGKRKRSWFITQATEIEIERLKFQKALKETAGAWKDKNHPELKKKKDVYNYLKKLRESFEQRIEQLHG